MSSTFLYSYSHSVTYVTDKLLKTLKDIIVLSGLDPAAFAEQWDDYARAIRTWLESGHLEKIDLEIYDPRTDTLITKFDIHIEYGWAASAEATLWTDTDQIRYAIKKHGLVPSSAKYDLKLHNKPGRPNVDGWEPGASRSTDGMVRQSLGTTVQHNGLGGQAGYWRAR